MNDESCMQTPFALVCLDAKTVTNTVVTPSGNLRYVNERHRPHDDLLRRHVHVLVGDPQQRPHEGRRGPVPYRAVLETTQSVSGTYSLTCEGGFDYHFANGSVQIGEYSFDCTVA